MVGKGFGKGLAVAALMLILLGWGLAEADQPQHLSPEEQEKLALQIFQKLGQTPQEELDTFYRLYQEVIRKCPDTERAEIAHWRLSNLLILGFEPPRRNEAAALLEGFLVRYPNSQGVDQVKNRLVVLYEETGQFCQAADLYSEIAPSLPTPPDDQGLATWLLFAEALEKCGRKVRDSSPDQESLAAEAAREALARLGP